MAADKDVKIKITTEGDVKGIKEVEKELDSTKEKVEKVGESSSESGQKGASGFKRFAGAMLSLTGVINPVDLAIRGLTAAIGFAKRKHEEWKEGIQRATEVAGQAITNFKSNLQQFVIVEREAAAASERFADAQHRSSQAILQRIDAARQLERSQLELTDANLAEKLSLIDLDEASKKITKEQANSKRLKARRAAENKKRNIEQRARTSEEKALERDELSKSSVALNTKVALVKARKKSDNFINLPSEKAKASKVAPKLNEEVGFFRAEEAQARLDFTNDHSEENKDKLSASIKSRQAAEKKRTKEIEKFFKGLQDDIKTLESAVDRTSAIARTAKINLEKKRSSNKLEDTTGQTSFDTRRRAEDNRLKAEQINAANAAKEQAKKKAESDANAAQKTGNVKDLLPGIISDFSGSKSGTVNAAALEQLKQALAAAQDGTNAQEAEKLAELFQSFTSNLRNVKQTTDAKIRVIEKALADVQSRERNTEAS